MLAWKQRKQRWPPPVRQWGVVGQRVVRRADLYFGVDERLGALSEQFVVCHGEELGLAEAHFLRVLDLPREDLVQVRLQRRQVRDLPSPPQRAARGPLKRRKEVDLTPTQCERIKEVIKEVIQKSEIMVFPADCSRPIPATWARPLWGPWQLGRHRGRRRRSRSSWRGSRAAGAAAAADSGESRPPTMVMSKTAD